MGGCEMDAAAVLLLAAAGLEARGGAEREGHSRVARCWWWWPVVCADGDDRGGRAAGDGIVVSGGCWVNACAGA